MPYARSSGDLPESSLRGGEFRDEGIDLRHARREAEVVGFDLCEELVLRYALGDRLPGARHPRVELRFVSLDIGPGEDVPVAGNRGVEIELEDAIEHLAPLDGAAAAGVIDQWTGLACGHHIADADHLHVREINDR